MGAANQYPQAWPESCHSPHGCCSHPRRTSRIITNQPIALLAYDGSCWQHQLGAPVALQSPS